MEERGKTQFDSTAQETMELVETPNIYHETWLKDLKTDTPCLINTERKLRAGN